MSAVSFSVLSFESTNKTDSIICKSVYNIPHTVQNYIKERLKTDEANDLLLLFQNAYGNKDLKKRDVEYKRGRIFFMRLNKDRENYNFTDPQLRLIIENGRGKRPSEMVKMIFPKLTDQVDINNKSRSVKDFLVALGIEYEGPAEEQDPEEDNLDNGGDYIPPETDDVVITKINRCDPSADWVRSRLDSNQKKCIRTLKNNLNQLKFKISINSYQKVIEKKLFETEFIRQTYDNPNLIPDDINACMMLCGEYVREMQIKEMINLLDAQMKATLEGESKSSMVLATNLKDKTIELKNCQNNIKDLQGQIHGHRTKRLEAESKYHQSLAQYVTIVSDQNKREKLLLVQKVYNENILQKEIDHLTDLPNNVGEVHGISINEILGFKHYISD